MKITSILPMVVLSVLMVGAVSCTTMQPVSNDDYATTSRQQQPARIYVQDPYNFGRTIIMDRDPMTGRYYQVYTTPVYDSRYDRYYSSNVYDRRYDDRRYNDRYYSNREQYPTRRQSQPAPTAEERKQAEQKREDAASILFGKKQ